MTREDMIAGLQAKSAWVSGKRIKVDFGAEGIVMIDGAAGRVSGDDGAADTVVAISMADLDALRRRELDPMSAFMQGRLRIDGDMANAMALQQVLGRLAE